MPSKLLHKERAKKITYNRFRVKKKKKKKKEEEEIC